MLEIVQTREFMPDEMLAIRRAAAGARIKLHDRVFWVLLLLLALGTGTLVFGLVHFIYLAKCAGVRLPQRMTVVFFGSIGVYLVLRWRDSQAIATERIGALASATRYWLDADGLNMHLAHTSSKYRWPAMQSISDTPTHLFIYLNAAVLIPITKSTFEGQDVPGFCAELQRRWTSARGAPTP